MLDIVRPKIQIPDDSKITINQYKNPYLTKLTIKILPNYAKIDGPTLLNPLVNHNNVAIVQALPLWRNEKFRIGLLWQQNIRNSFNRSHFGFSAEYQMTKNWTLRTKNLVGTSFLTSTELRKVLAFSGKGIICSGLYSSFFESSNEVYHTIGAGISIDNTISLSLNKRIGSQTALQANYEKNLQSNTFLRIKYETEIEQINDSSVQLGLGYYLSKNSSAWLRTTVQSNKIEPNMSVQMELRKNNNSHCFISSVQFRNEKSIIYLGYKCPSFNFIFPIFGTDSVIPTLIGLGVFILGYFKRSNHQDEKSEQKQKNRIEELKLISDKANENYRKQDQLNGLLIQQVYIGFLNEQNRLSKLNRNQVYKNGIFDGTVSFRFYVQKGELYLPKGNKLSMIGLSYDFKEGQEIQCYVKYQKKGKQYEKVWKISDQIKL